MEKLGTLKHAVVMVWDLMLFLEKYMCPLFQLSTVNLDNPDDCFAKFRSNSWLGVVMFLGIVTGTLLKEDKKDETKNEAT